MTYNVFSGTLNPTHSLTHLTFLVPAYPGCPGKEAVKRVSVMSCLVCLHTFPINLLFPISTLRNLESKLNVRKTL